MSQLCPEALLKRIFQKQHPFGCLVEPGEQVGQWTLYILDDAVPVKAGGQPEWLLLGSFDSAAIASKVTGAVLFCTDTIPKGKTLVQVQRLACSLGELWFCLTRNDDPATKTADVADSGIAHELSKFATEIGQTDRWSINPSIASLEIVEGSDACSANRVLFDPEGGTFWLCFRKPYYSSSDNPLLVHVHIPKNGGTSLHKLLTSNFAERHHSLYFDDPMRSHSAASLSRHLLEKSESEVISSHEIRQFPPRIGGRLALYFCFLRDPAQRNLSYFRYIQKDWDSLSPEHRKRLPENAREMAAEQFFNWCQNHLKGYAPMAAQTHFLSQTYRWEAAREALEKFIFVGITERFEESMFCFRIILRHLGIPFTCDSIPQQNATLESGKRGASADQALPTLLKSGVDRELYDWANRRLDRQIAEFS